MRYTINSNNINHNHSEFIVDSTVIFTLITGLIFLYFGIKFKKMWIKFWGVVAILACLSYFIYHSIK